MNSFTQIGSGQPLDLLGMKLIIDSKLREAGLRPGRISIQEIIADIYTNVTTNPLIESKQKSTYQQQVKKLGLSNTINKKTANHKKSEYLSLNENFKETRSIVIEGIEKERTFPITLLH